MFYKVKLMLILLFSLPALSVLAAEDFNEIKQRAEQGDAKAQAKYGAIYFLGENFKLKPNARFKTKQALKAVSHLLKGVSSDHQLATKWMLKAADQGDVNAQVFMAAMYDRGMGVKQDPSKATRLYKQAAKNGNETAEAILGRYAQSRIVASKDIPFSYALKILNSQ